VTRVLVVDDEPQILRALGINLRARGYDVDLAPDGEHALTLAASHHPDVVVLDLGLPGIDGVEVIRGLRGWSTVPIVVLSVRDGERDKVSALDAGADDYVSKPFSVGELIARMRVALRHTARVAQDTSAPFTVGDLRVDLVRRRVFVGEREVRLTPIEYRLLTTLIRHAGKVVTHRQLLKEVWGPPYADQAQYVRVYMGQLRRKLCADPARPRYLVTEPGVGYRLAVD
jgi:two-component system KDP operon response regulator KdpE